MKNAFYIAYLLLTLLTISCSQGEAKINDNTKINWHNDYQNALQVAQKEDKLVMLDLYTDWCTWCKELDERTFVDPSVIAKASNFIAVKINAEADLMGDELVNMYNIQGYPAVLFLDKNGSILTRVNGFVEADDFITYMEEALLMPSVIAEIENGNDKNIEAVAYYMNMGDIEAAKIVFDAMVAKGSIDYIDGRSESVASLDKDFIVAQYFDMGLKYMYQIGDLERARALYEKLADEYVDSDFIYSIDINILNLYNAMGDKDKIVDYINNIALKRNNLPKEYTDMYQSVLKDFEQK